MGNALITGWHECTADKTTPADITASVGGMVLNIHRHAAAGKAKLSPLTERPGTLQYAVMAPDSSQQHATHVVVDAGYGKSELDAQVRAAQALVSFFDTRAKGLGPYVTDRDQRKKLGLVDVPLICLEVARVDIAAATELLADTLRHAREDQVTVPDGTPKDDQAHTNEENVIPPADDPTPGPKDDQALKSPPKAPESSQTVQCPISDSGQEAEYVKITRKGITSPLTESLRPSGTHVGRPVSSELREIGVESLESTSSLRIAPRASGGAS